MKTKTKKSIKNVLIFIALLLLTTVNVILLEFVIGWLAGDENICWKSVLFAGIGLSVAVVIVEILLARSSVQGRGRDIISVCRKIILPATIMFGCSVLLFNNSADAGGVFETTEWLSLSLSMAIFIYLYERKQQYDIQQDENGLVVVAECQDIQSAEMLCERLESNSIRAMIVEKESPIYIKGGNAPIQIQVCRKDLNAAKNHLGKSL